MGTLRVSINVTEQGGFFFADVNDLPSTSVVSDSRYEAAYEAAGAWFEELIAGIEPKRVLPVLKPNSAKPEDNYELGS